MQLRHYLLTALGIIILTLITVGYFRLQSENKALQESLDSFRETYEVERAELARITSELGISIDSLRTIDQGYQDELERLKDRQQDINQKFNDEKNRIHSYTADSLERFFSRRYR